MKIYLYTSKMQHNNIQHIIWSQNLIMATSYTCCIHRWNSCFFRYWVWGLGKLWNFSGFVNVKKNFSNSMPQFQLQSYMYYFLLMCVK
jgi:hypothetical protein